MPTLVGTQKWKPDKEELEKELRKLGLAKEDVKLSKLEDELLLDPSNPVENVGYENFYIYFLCKILDQIPLPSNWPLFEAT